MIKINNLLIIYTLSNCILFHAMENTPLLKKNNNKKIITEKIQNISVKLSAIEKELNTKNSIIIMNIDDTINNSHQNDIDLDVEKIDRCGLNTAAIGCGLWCLFLPCFIYSITQIH